ncbi:MAG: hypothetical protein EAZ55_08390 [Cytophagales bacterium]|nr:MAG: hypothetical protein EAZ55_08390 [Cytophagales bacterium]
MEIRELTQNSFIKIGFLDAYKALVYHWLPATIDMFEEEYQQNMRLVLKHFTEENGEYVVVDTLQSQFAVGVEMQEWLQHNVIIPAIEKGLKKVLIITSNNTVTRISYEQVFEHEISRTFETLYFQELTTALDFVAHHYQQIHKS